VDPARTLPSLIVAVLLLANLPPGVAAQRADPPGFQPRECDGPLTALGARCGSYSVFEDRAAGAGRTIDLNVVVIPASGDESATEAITFLSGGPGQAATAIAAYVARVHEAMRRDRDFLLVDQRGTGGSSPLLCELYDPADPASWMGDYFPPDAIRTCRDQLERRADLRLYTTALAVDDLDEVREAFGYRNLTLMGTSYGTRAALAYMRRHPDHVRAAVLEGAAPPHEFMPVAFPQDAQRALDGVLAACETDAICAAAFPTVRDDAHRALAALDEGPAPVDILEPVGGDVIQVSLTRDLAAEAIRYMLYSAGSTAFLPVVLHHAAAGDYGALAEFALFGRRNIVAAGAMGLYLSITCAEDLPWIPEGAGERAAEGTFLRDYRLRQQRAACELWPRGPVPDDFAEPVHAPAPTLILSGEWDPVTPPRLGDTVDRWLPQSRHLVVPDAGHGSSGLVNADCLRRIVSAFVNNPDVHDLDTTCLADVHRTPFATRNPAPPPVTLEPASLQTLAGDYQAIDAPVQAAVRHDGDRLRLQLSGGQRFVLAPTGPDRFRVVGGFGLAVTFQRAEGAVHMTLVEGDQPQLNLRRLAP
jgi:pimeloyl-ACP methyl ester carboxylesterase